MIKSIGYAYPTSPYANRLKAGADGCFYVETKARETSPRCNGLYGPFATLLDAETCAAPMAAKWSRYTRRAA